jgi:AraC-like DNA-binding protein
MLSTYLQQLMLSLAETGTISSASSAPDAVTFRQAISYLNSNIHRQPSVPELARFCNVSESGLKRIFDKYAGISIHKYLLKMKVKTAAELLQQGESVSCVAEKLGFNSQSYFSRAFRRETGVMPSSLK